MTQMPTPIPAAPPTTPGFLVAPNRPAAWPSVIGILCIVFGAMGTLAGLWGAGSQIMFLMGTIPVQTYGMGSAGPELIAELRHLAAPQIAAECAKLVVSAILIFIGIGMIQRRPVARPAAVWWAVAKVFVALVATAIIMWVQFVTMQHVQEAMAKDPNSPPQMAAILPTIMWSSMGVIAVFQLAWSCALPAFLLIWFTRPKVKAEVARWATRLPSRTAI